MDTNYISIYRWDKIVPSDDSDYKTFDIIISFNIKTFIYYGCLRIIMVTEDCTNGGGVILII